MVTDSLSIVIATHKEDSLGFLPRMARRYPENPKFKYIIVDSGQTAPEVFMALGRADFQVLQLKNSNRAQRLAYGLSMTTSPMVLFHHPRSLVEPEALRFLAENSASLSWGGLTHSFDKKTAGLQWTSWYSNTIRPRLWRVVYLDHSIFFHRHLLDRPIPPISIFEDTEISKILAAHGPPKILPFVTETSAIRFETHGFWRQALTNQYLKLAYHLGLSKPAMNRVYEKNLKLNE